MRRQAMRMREELKLPWKEIARVVGVHTSTVIGCSKYYSMEGTSILKSKTRGRRYLLGRTLTLSRNGSCAPSSWARTPCRLPCGTNRRALMRMRVADRMDESFLIREAKVLLKHGL